MNIGTSRDAVPVPGLVPDVLVLETPTTSDTHLTRRPSVDYVTNRLSQGVAARLSLAVPRGGDAEGVPSSLAADEAAPEAALDGGFGGRLAGPASSGCRGGGGVVLHPAVAAVAAARPPPAAPPPPPPGHPSQGPTVKNGGSPGPLNLLRLLSNGMIQVHCDDERTLLQSSADVMPWRQ